MDMATTFREVMGNYPTGVTVVTMKDAEGNPIGMTVNSFASVSLDPVLILWSIDKKSHSYDKFIATEQFAVNILAADQGDLCTLFSSKVMDRFNQCNWNETEQKLPALADALAVLQCKTFKQVDAGDHTILIGEVFDIRKETKEPLLYHRRTIGAIPTDFYK